MQPSTHSLDGILARASRSSRFALIRGLALGALALGCTEPSAPAATLESTPNEIIIIGGRQVAVFNAELRAIGNPDENQGTVGHLQLRLSAGEDAGIIIEWRLVFTDDASWPYCASQSPGAGSLAGASTSSRTRKIFRRPRSVPRSTSWAAERSRARGMCSSARRGSRRSSPRA